MDWFEDWFDSPLYEKLYSHRNQKEATQLAALIADKIPKTIYPNLLDLGCGRGRHSITFANMGYTVTGVDLSEEAIHKAKKIAHEQKINNLRFFIGDMRTPLPDRFDAVLNLFTTFGYFNSDAENTQVLKNVQVMLKEKGMFVLDFLNRKQVEKTLIPKEEGAFQDLHYIIKRDILNDMVIKTIHFSGPSLPKPIQYQERVKLYTLDWFQNQLSACGLELLYTYGNYTGDSFEVDSSPRMVMFSRKTG